MKFCPDCGAHVVQRIPENDNRLRYICEQCTSIHYHNPKLVVGCLLAWKGKVLLCRRSIKPRYGYWTLPAGFMENQETTMEGAAREAWEEANAISENLQLFGIYNLPRIDQVYVMFHGDLKDGHASAGEESLQVRLFDEADIPWQELAFPVVTETLQRFFERDKQRSDQSYLADIHSTPDHNFRVVRHH